MRIYFILPCILFFCGLIDAEPLMQAETLTRISLAEGVKNSITLDGPLGFVKSWFEFPWDFDTRLPVSAVTGIANPVWHKGFSSALVELGPLYFRRPGNFLCKPFSSDRIASALEGRPFSLASPGDSRFSGIVLGKEQGFFILEEESEEPVFGLWDTRAVLNSGFIAALQKKAPRQNDEWFGDFETVGLASWALVHVLRTGDYSQFLIVGGKYTEFPGRTGFFLRTDSRLSADLFYLDTGFCFSDGDFRAVGGSIVALYDIRAALGLARGKGQSIELELKESENKINDPPNRTVSLLTVTDLGYCMMDLDIALDFNTLDAIQLYRIETILKPFFLNHASLASNWEGSAGKSRKFDIALVLGMKGAFSLESTLMLRFLDTSRSLKASCAFGMRLGECGIKIQAALIEPWIFHPESKSPKFDFSLQLSTSTVF